MGVDWSNRLTMSNRAAFLVSLDTAMLLLVCLLEPIKFTGLEWHQWLGLALCPLVLLHVVMQWPWFITQFQAMGRRGGYRVRASALLNLALFVLMRRYCFPAYLPPGNPPRSSLKVPDAFGSGTKFMAG